MSKNYTTEPTAAAAAPAEAAVAPNVLPLKANHPFILMVSPTSWECVETDKGVQWLPRLKIFHETPGVNGVKGGPGLPTNSDVSRAQAEKMGRLLFTAERKQAVPDEILALEDPPLPEAAGKSYMVRYRVARGYHYLARWDVPVKFGAEVVLETNYLMKWAYQRWLLDTGRVPAPDPAVLAKARHMKRKRISRNQKRKHLPEAAEAIEQAQADITAMSEAERKQGFGRPLTMASKKADLVEHCEFLGLDYKRSMSKASLLELITKAPK